MIRLPLATLLLFVGLAHSLELTGVIRPQHSLQLSFLQEGIIAEISVRDGDKVTQNQALLKLDDTLQALESERRRLLLQDGSRLDSARREEKIHLAFLNSGRELYQRTKSISQDEVRQMELKHEISLGNLRSLEASKEREKVEYEMSEQMLARYTLRAPLAGVITKQSAEKGEWVRGGDPVLTLVDSSVCQIDVNVENQLLPRLKIGTEVLIEQGGSEAQIRVMGSVIYVSPVADQASGLVLVRAEFSNPDGLIIPGVPATLKLQNQ